MTSLALLCSPSSPPPPASIVSPHPPSACSAAIASATGKPESYVAVCVNDGASMIFGGSDAPLALGCVYSIGAVGMESNGAITKAVSDLLSAYGVAADRVYVNFFDMPRANVGWNGKTFAG